MADGSGTETLRLRPGRAAAFFDLDKTIIATSSATAFGRKFRAGGLITRRAMLRTAYAQFLFVVGGADHDQVERLRRFMSGLVTGWDVATVRAIVADTLHNVIDPTVYDEAVSLIEEHKAAGRDVVVVSTSGSEVVEPIGAMLGADRVIATRLEIVDGTYTGGIEHYVYGQEKAAAVSRLADERGYDLAASFGYSDSITDLPLLELVGHPHAVNPDRELRRQAVAREWPVLVFSKPVGLRSRTIPGRPTIAALAVTGLALGSAWWWRQAARRRTAA